MYKCSECGCTTELSWFREDETETVCEDCYMEYLKKEAKLGIFRDEQVTKIVCYTCKDFVGIIKDYDQDTDIVKYYCPKCKSYRYEIANLEALLYARDNRQRNDLLKEYKEI